MGNACPNNCNYDCCDQNYNCTNVYGSLIITKETVSTSTTTTLGSIGPSVSSYSSSSSSCLLVCVEEGELTSSEPPWSLIMHWWAIEAQSWTILNPCMTKIPTIIMASPTSTTDTTSLITQPTTSPATISPVTTSQTRTTFKVLFLIIS